MVDGVACPCSRGRWRGRRRCRGASRGWGDDGSLSRSLFVAILGEMASFAAIQARSSVHSALAFSLRELSLICEVLLVFVRRRGGGRSGIGRGGGLGSRRGRLIGRRGLSRGVSRVLVVTLWLVLARRRVLGIEGAIDLEVRPIGSVKTFH